MQFQISGIAYTGTYTWNSEGSYTMTAKARDIYGVKSNWNEKQIEIPRNNIFSNTLFLHLLEIFPNAYLIIRYILE